MARAEDALWKHDRTSNNIHVDPEELLERQAYSQFVSRSRSHLYKAESADLSLGGNDESCIAINPTNPNNIAYASLYELRVSTDGGQTFAAPKPSALPSTHLPAGDPSITFDSQGRLFWTYIGVPTAGGDASIFIAHCDPATGAFLPGYPVNVSQQSGFVGSCTDKEWLAADSWPSSPYHDRLYIAWIDMSSCGFFTDRLVVTSSADHGVTWSPTQILIDAVSMWPLHVATAPTGDVYIACHMPDLWYQEESTGAIRMFRSSDGGATFAPTAHPFPPGTAGITRNSDASIPGARFWLQGSLQPWILPDPITPGAVSVVSADDPDNTFYSWTDYSDVFITRSADFGATWSTPLRVHSTSAALQVMPTAAIDRTNGNIAVAWYDTREGATNPAGLSMLDTYVALSTDGGQSFSQEFRINDVRFDPDQNAPCRFNCPPLLTGSWVESPSNAYVCGDAAYHWDGVAWSEISPGGGSNRGVWGAAQNQVWIVGVSGQIKYYDGVQWSLQSSGVSSNLWAICGRGAQDVYAVGDGGAVVHWDGVAWSPQTTGVSALLRGVWTSPGGLVWAVGSAGTVLKYDGNAWSASASIATGEWLRDVWGSTDNDVWVVGLNGGLYHWNGASWTTMQSGAATLFTVWGSSPSDVYFAGKPCRLLHWNGTQLELSQELGGEVVRHLSGSSASSMLAAGQQGLVWRRNGASWNRDGMPGIPGNPVTRIGEYIGIAIAGVRGAATWTGNSTNTNSNPAPQQTVFGDFLLPTVSADDLESVATVALLEPGRPNPFRWVTRLGYRLPVRGQVELAIHDARGRRIRMIESGERSAGRHDATWDGLDQSGQSAPAGVYFATLKAGSRRSVSKVVLAR